MLESPAIPFPHAIQCKCRLWGKKTKIRVCVTYSATQLCPAVQLLP